MISDMECFPELIYWGLEYWVWSFNREETSSPLSRAEGGTGGSINAWLHRRGWGNPEIYPPVVFNQTLLQPPAPPSLSIVCSVSKAWLFQGLLGANCSLGKSLLGASLVVHWLRICGPVWGTVVLCLFWEDPTYHRATKPRYHNCWSLSALGPGHHKRSHHSEKPMHCHRE